MAYKAHWSPSSRAAGHTFSRVVSPGGITHIAAANACCIIKITITRWPLLSVPTPQRLEVVGTLCG